MIDLVPNHFEFVAASYGSASIFFDIKNQMQIFTLESVANSKLVVGSAEFFNRFTYGQDIHPGVAKTLTVSFYKTKGGKLFNVCANDGETLDYNRAF